MNILRGCLGIFGLLALCWLCGLRRRRLPWRVLLWGIGLQFGIAALLTRVPLCARLLSGASRGIALLGRASDEGARFVFGYLAGGEAPFVLREGVQNTSLFFFGPLMMLILVGALSSILFYYGIMQKIVNLFARLLSRTMGLGGAESVAVAANVFLGQSDAPLLIRPYVRALSAPELLCVMTAGMTTISGSLMVVFAQMLDPLLPGLAAGHLLLASLISAPAAVMAARLMMPVAPGEVNAAPPRTVSESSGPLDALISGAMDGAKVAVSVAVLVLAVIAIVSLLNGILARVPHPWSPEPLSLSWVLGWLFAPVVWLMGIPWAEAQAAGDLMATKLVFNEFVAYIRFAEVGPQLSTHTRLIMLYALCGFANFSSIGISVGALSALAPDRRAAIAAVGFRAMLAGTLAAMLTGTIIGMIS